MSVRAYTENELYDQHKVILFNFADESVENTLKKLRKIVAKALVMPLTLVEIVD